MLYRTQMKLRFGKCASSSSSSSRLWCNESAAKVKPQSKCNCKKIIQFVWACNELGQRGQPQLELSLELINTGWQQAAATTTSNNFAVAALQQRQHKFKVASLLMWAESVGNHSKQQQQQQRQLRERSSHTERANRLSLSRSQLARRTQCAQIHTRTINRCFAFGHLRFRRAPPSLRLALIYILKRIGATAHTTVVLETLRSEDRARSRRVNETRNIREVSYKKKKWKIGVYKPQKRLTCETTKEKEILWEIFVQYLKSMTSFARKLVSVCKKQAKDITRYNW